VLLYGNNGGELYFQSLKYCDTGFAAGINAATNPGVIQAVIGLGEKEALEPEPLCSTTELIVGCSRHLGNSVAVSSKEVVGTDLEERTAFIAAFLNTFVEKNMLVREYINLRWSLTRPVRRTGSWNLRGHSRTART
jgi:hypothetical protein